jgi:hypothetical protein
MMRSGFAVGMVAGLAVALVLVAGVSILGLGAQRIDLVPAAAAPNAPTQSVGLAGQAVTTGNVAPSAQVKTQAAPSSALNALSTDGRGSLALVFVPILLGAAGGAVLYSLSLRKVDAE